VIPTKKFPPKHFEERKILQKYLRKSQKKEKRREQRIWHEIEKEDFTMNILAKSGYKPLKKHKSWMAKAQAKSQLSPLPFSLKEHPKIKEHSHH
jgi:hypothetical protein